MARDRLRSTNEDMVDMKRKLESVMSIHDQQRDDTRKIRAQLQDQSEELTRTLDEVTNQGKHLAEARSLLIERDLELRDAREKIARQTQALDQFKEVAGEKIRSLQVELARIKQQ